MKLKYDYLNYAELNEEELMEQFLVNNFVYINGNWVDYDTNMMLTLEMWQDIKRNIKTDLRRFKINKLRI